MRRWAALTVGFYCVALVLLTLPVIAVAFAGDSRLPTMLKVFAEPGYWVWLGLMAIGQALLLLLPLDSTEKRLVERRPLFVPVMSAAFFLGVLCASGLLSVLCVFFKDDAFKLVEFLSLPAHFDPEGQRFQPVVDFLGFGHRDDFNIVSGIGTFIAIFWLPWTLVFLHFAKTNDSASLLKRMTRWLLRGSILEFLVALPSHIIVRRRDDCCAPMATFWGITMGISVMLLCFGPGVFFLFVERFGRLRAKAPVENSANS